MSDHGAEPYGAFLTPGQLAVDRVMRDVVGGGRMAMGGSAAMAAGGWLGPPVEMLRRMDGLRYEMTPECWNQDVWSPNPSNPNQLLLLRSIPEALPILPSITSALREAGLHPEEPTVSIRAVWLGDLRHHVSIEVHTHDDLVPVEISLNADLTQEELEAGVVGREAQGKAWLEQFLFWRDWHPYQLLDYASMAKWAPEGFTELRRVVHEEDAAKRMGALNWKTDQMAPRLQWATRQSAEIVMGRLAEYYLGKSRVIRERPLSTQSMGVLDGRRAEAAGVMQDVLLDAARNVPPRALLDKDDLRRLEKGIFENLELTLGPLDRSVHRQVMQAVEARNAGKEL